MEKSLSCFQFSHQKCFLTELIFPQLKRRSKQKIKVKIHSKRQQASQHLISITGNKYQAEEVVAAGGLGPEVLINTQAPHTVPSQVHPSRD